MLPYKDNSRYEVKLNRREATYDDAVRAGHGSAAACGAGADTDDADGAAGQTEQDVEVAQVDADGLEDRSASSGVGLNGALNVSACSQM